MVLAQIQALRDAGAHGFCAWNARNVYTISDYDAPLPEANPNPPLRAVLIADLERNRPAESSPGAAAGKPNSKPPSRGPD
jgi:hypothetical protein